VGYLDGVRLGWVRCHVWCRGVGIGSELVGSLGWVRVIGVPWCRNWIEMSGVS